MHNSFEKGSYAAQVELEWEEEIAFTRAFWLVGGGKWGAGGWEGVRWLPGRERFGSLPSGERTASATSTNPGEPRLSPALQRLPAPWVLPAGPTPRSTAIPHSLFWLLSPEFSPWASAGVFPSPWKYRRPLTPRAAVIIPALKPVIGSFPRHPLASGPPRATSGEREPGGSGDAC